MGFVENLLAFHNWWNSVGKIKANIKKSRAPLRLGILSAAAINFTAIIDPVQTHNDVQICAIAARQRSKAQAQIDKNQLGSDCKAYGSYDELLVDPDIDAVYIPLPCGLHAEWAVKAMEAGKHVLIEKPMTANAEQVRKIQEASSKTDKIALEAFHWRFHPAAHRAKELLDDGKYGHPLKIHARLVTPAGTFDQNDIRMNYDLGGGACLDLTYVFCASCYYASQDITKCTFKVSDTRPRLNKADKRVEEAVESEFIIEQADRPPVECHVEADLMLPPFLGFIPRFWALEPSLIIELEKARIHFHNFVGPMYTHSISITEKDENGNLTNKTHTEKCYAGGAQWGERGQAWWTTYRYQLEAFVDRVRARENGKKYEGPWMDLKESEKVMELIDAVYDNASLPRRGI